MDTAIDTDMPVMDILIKEISYLRTTLRARDKFIDFLRATHPQDPTAPQRIPPPEMASATEQAGLSGPVEQLRDALARVDIMDILTRLDIDDDDDSGTTGPAMTTTRGPRVPAMTRRNPP